MAKAAKEAGPQAAANDKSKVMAAGAVIALSLFLFYYFSEGSFFYRVLGFVGGLLVAAGLFFTTTQGRATSAFLATARVELRKMVWPTKAETLQTTLIVFIVVMIVAVFLWMLDRLLSLFMQWLLG